MVGEEHENVVGTLHGGFTATLVDTFTTMALMSSEQSNPGVTINLNLRYQIQTHASYLYFRKIVHTNIKILAELSNLCLNFQTTAKTLIF